ncbi:MAG: hypothetical protein C4524_04605 [Candidatus Zixiibacteriota bacterium]|nr:MAG: hypothetical protein C4524_04605 [candidate division Zixibacteria bacterium]
MEATLSMVMLSILFLGFTVSLLAVREWMNRHWAIRVMDQYAHDFMSHLDSQFRRALAIEQAPPRYGLGSFRVKIANYNFTNLQEPVQGISSFVYYTNPNQGIYIGVNNGGGQKFDDRFPPEGYSDLNDRHQFIFTEFTYPGPYTELNRESYFREPMAQVRFSIRYQRPRKVMVNGGLVNRTFAMTKQYRMAGFLKNYLDSQ